MAKTKMTRTLIIINIAVFLIMTAFGGTESIDNLVRFNALVKPLVYQGQWWRLICAQFIHIGFFHILMNMYFLNEIGPIFEKLYGPRNFLIIYLLSGLIGNLFTYAFGSLNSVSAGASTSLYGLLGLAIGIMLNYHNDEILRSFGASFISVVAINLIYSFLMPRVGILGHLGGFIGGLVLAGIFPIINRDLPKTRISLALVILVILLIGFIYIGNRSVRMGI
ncbi:MAG: rhomboid family intramembrane serine protease [Peptoniphilaceae bacterium]|nr:rhomboid family intramembrane serine protease [Peptoniphilaceae bacterium]MDY6019540.1 rhomboid family intramembrane serine protease [Anaerococcus sp.]